MVTRSTVRVTRVATALLLRVAAATSDIRQVRAVIASSHIRATAAASIDVVNVR